VLLGSHWRPGSLGIKDIGRTQMDAETPRAKAWRKVEILEHDKSVIAKRRQLLCRTAKAVEPYWKPNPHLEEADNAVAQMVKPALADYFERNAIFPVTKHQEENIYLAYYIVAAKHFIEYLKRQMQP
jgi:hypothetical protein